MEPDYADKQALANPEDVERNRDYGVYCKKWRKRDTRPWCFVGFDTTCGDRRPTHSTPALKMTRLGQVSQFKSSNPCQREELEGLYSTCVIWVGLFRCITILATVVQLPLGIMTFVFLSHHCGDHVEMSD